MMIGKIIMREVVDCGGLSDLEMAFKHNPWVIFFMVSTGDHMVDAA